MKGDSYLHHRYENPEQFYDNFDPLHAANGTLNGYDTDSMSSMRTSDPGAQSISDYRVIHEHINVYRSRGRMPSLRTIAKLGAAAAITAVGYEAVQKIEGIHLLNIPSLSQLWHAIDAPPGATVNGSTYYNHLSHPPQIIVSEVQGGSKINLETTGGLFDVNLPVFGNPTEQGVKNLSRAGNIALLANLDQDGGIHISPPPNQSEPASTTNKPTVYVPERALKVERTGIECAVVPGTNHCTGKYEESKIKEVMPLVPVAALMMPAAEGVSMLAKIAGVGIFNSISQELTGPNIDPVSETEDAAKDADFAYEHGCGHNVLSSTGSIKAGLKKDFSLIFALNSRRAGSNTSKGKALQSAANPANINVVLINSQGQPETGKTITLNYADPNPTKAYIASQLGNGIKPSDVHYNATSIEACTYRNPAAQNKHAINNLMNEVKGSF